MNDRLFAQLSQIVDGQKELAKSLHISPNTVSSWKARGTPPPSKYIPQIAEFLDVSVGWLISGEGYPSASEEVVPASVHEKALLGVFRALPPLGRQVALKQIVALVEAFPETESANENKIPEHSRHNNVGEKEEAPA